MLHETQDRPEQKSPNVNYTRMTPLRCIIVEDEPLAAEILAMREAALQPQGEWHDGAA